jgi:hypothetical protein
MTIRKLAVAALVAGLGTAVRADEVLDTIGEAVQHYKAGRKAEAVQGLEYAANLVRQGKGQAIAALLPRALPGWTAQGDEAQTQVAGQAAFGGVIDVKRVYVGSAAAEGEEARVEIEIMTDSPLTQAAIVTLNNPVMLASGGGKMERIGGERAIVEYAQRSGSVTLIVDSRYLVKVSGSAAALADLKAYAAAIDFKKLAAIK